LIEFFSCCPIARFGAIVQSMKMLHSTFHGHIENGTSGAPPRITLGLQTQDRRAKNGCSKYHTSL